MIEYSMISLPKIPCIHHLDVVLANPTWQVTPNEIT